MGYTDILVLLRLRLIPVIFVFAGPRFSFLASRNYQLGNVMSDSTDPIIGHDVAGVLGAQVVLPLGFNVQASDDIGLSLPNYFGLEVKNRVYKIWLGYSFGGN